MEKFAEKYHFPACLKRWLTMQLPTPNLSEAEVVSLFQIAQLELQGKQKRKDGSSLWLHCAMTQECCGWDPGLV